MKIKIGASELAHCLKTAMLALPRREVRQTTQLIKIESEDAMLQATCTDEEIFISAWCYAGIEDAEAFLVNPQRLLSLAERAGDGEMNLHLDGTQLKITGADTATMQTADAEEFPAPIVGGITESFVLSPAALKSLAVSFAAGPTLGENVSVMMDNDRVLCAVASGVRATIVATEGKIEEDTEGVLIPLGYLQSAVKATTSPKIGLAGTQAVLEGEHSRATILTVNGNAKVWQSYLVTPAATSLRFGRDLESALRTILAFSGYRKACRMRYESGEVIFTSMEGDDRLQTKPLVVEIQGDADPFEEIFNAQFLLDICRDLDEGWQLDFVHEPQTYMRAHLNDVWHIFMPMIATGQ